MKLFIYESINKHTNPLTKTEILAFVYQEYNIFKYRLELQKQIIKYNEYYEKNKR